MKVILLLVLLTFTFTITEASVLSDAAASMNPRTFRPIINSTGIEIGMFRVGVTNECVFPFANDAAWDPVNEKILFIGAPHQHPWVWGFPVYDVATNNWRNGNQGPYFNPTGQINTHSYDNIASVYGTGKMYFYTPTPTTHPQRSTFSYCLNVYDIPTDTWDIELIPNEMVSGPYSALNYFPDINSLIYTNAGKISRYNLGTKSWSVLGSRTMGGIHNVGEYDPVHKIMLVGGGLDSRQLYKIDTLLNITPIAVAPKVLDVSSMLFTCDPVTGTFLLWEKDSIYVYDVPGNTWSAHIKSPIANFEAAWAVATPIKEHGIVAFMTNYSWPLLLYKHANPAATEKSALTQKGGLNRLEVFPSPANSATEIVCKLPGNGRGLLEIVSIEGKRVNSFNISDKRIYQWNQKDNSGNKIPAGVYLVRFIDNSNSSIQTVRILITK